MVTCPFNSLLFLIKQYGLCHVAFGNFERRDLMRKTASSQHSLMLPSHQHCLLYGSRSFNSCIVAPFPATLTRGSVFVLDKTTRFANSTSPFQKNAA